MFFFIQSYLLCTWWLTRLLQINDTSPLTSKAISHLDRLKLNYRESHSHKHLSWTNPTSLFLVFPKHSNLSSHLLFISRVGCNSCTFSASGLFFKAVLMKCLAAPISGTLIMAGCDPSRFVTCKKWHRVKVIVCNDFSTNVKHSLLNYGDKNIEKHVFMSSISFKPLYGKAQSIIFRRNLQI